jgi:hypothetical protein
LVNKQTNNKLLIVRWVNSKRIKENRLGLCFPLEPEAKYIYIYFDIDIYISIALYLNIKSHFKIYLQIQKTELTETATSVCFLHTENGSCFPRLANNKR